MKVVEELGKRTCEPAHGKRVGKKTSKTLMMLMNKKKTPSRYPSRSFQKRLIAERAMQHRLGWGAQQREGRAADSRR